MAYRITFRSTDGTSSSDTAWPEDEGSAQRHAMAQVETNKASAAEIFSDDGTSLWKWPAE